MNLTTAKTTARSDRGYQWLRLVIVLLLLTAATLKGYQLSTEPLPGHGLLESRWLLIGVVEFELFFGLWLLAGVWPKPTWAVVLTCFTMFACISLYKALSGYATCGCFGRVPVNPWYTATLDLAIILSLLHWRPKGQRLPVCTTRQLPVRVVTVLVIWLSIGLPGGYAMGSYSPTTLSDAGKIIGDGKIVALEPEKWIGKRLPLLAYIHNSDQLQEGEWLVLLYHHDCPKCQAVIQNLPQIIHGLGGQQIALVEIPPYADGNEAIGSLGVPFIHRSLVNTRTWFLESPVGLLVSNGVVFDIRHNKALVDAVNHIEWY